MSPDYVRLIEAAYRVDLDESAWLRGLAEAALPQLDRGLGTVVYYMDLRDPKRPTASFPIVAGDNALPPELGEKFLGADTVPPEAMAEAYARGRVFATASESVLDVMEESYEKTGQHGMHDFLALNCYDPSGVCLTVGAPLPERQRTTASERALWSRIAAHFSAGFRLRRELQAVSDRGHDVLDRADALIDDRFEIAHAGEAASDREARDELRAAARAIDRARARLRRDDPGAAVELWKGLVDGTWSLVDHFDGDGRRYFVAQRNPPEARGPRALTDRERQVSFYAARGESNKLIAYRLGLPVGSVAAHLSRAIAKLGLGAREDLAYLAIPRDEEPS